jgi:hypothetical protein
VTQALQALQEEAQAQAVTQALQALQEAQAQAQANQ